MRKPPLAFASLLLATAACGGGSDGTPAAPTDVQAHISSDLLNVLTVAQAATNAGSAALPSGTTLDVLTKVLGVSLSSSSSVTVMPAPDVRADGSGSASGGSGGFDPNSIVQQLDSQLFTAANYQGNGVYTVPASLVCQSTDVTSDGSGTTTTTSIDPTCAMSLAMAQLQVLVTLSGDELQFTIEVDAQHDDLLTVTLTHTSLALSLDLDGTSRAIAALAPLLGESAPNAQLAGQVSAELDVLGAEHIKLSSSIDRDVSVQFADTGVALTSDAAFRFTSAASQLVTLDLDGSVPSAQLDVALGATTAHIPGDTDDDNGSATTGPSSDLDLPGATLSATLAAHALTISHVGLGSRTTTLSRGGQQALAIDLNPDDGREVAAAFGTDASGNETLTLTPKLDVRMTANDALLGDGTPEYDVAQLLVTGVLTGEPSGVKVGGELKIVTTPASFGIDATAGQCVTSTDAEDETSGADYTVWTAGPCQ